MVNVGVKEVKNNLSQLLTLVKSGEDILITKRGRPIARIIKEDPNDSCIRATLGSLAQEGLITLSSRSILKDHISLMEASGKPISEMVIEDRR